MSAGAAPRLQDAEVSVVPTWNDHRRGALGIQLQCLSQTGYHRAVIGNYAWDSADHNPRSRQDAREAAELDAARLRAWLEWFHR